MPVVGLSDPVFTAFFAYLRHFHITIYNYVALKNLRKTYAFLTSFRPSRTASSRLRISFVICR